MQAKVIESIRSSVDGLKSAIQSGNKEAEARWQKRFDELEFQVKKTQKAPNANQRGEETKAFLDAVKLYTKGGVAAVQQKYGDMKVSRNTPNEQKSSNLVRFDITGAGALLMPEELSTDINKQIVEISPVMQVAKVVSTDAPTFRQTQRNTSLTAAWLAEEATGAKTKDGYGYVDIPVHKLAARVGWTIEQEQDEAYNLESEINDSIREQFDKTLGTAFINGNGVGKPTGMVGNVTNFDSSSLALTTDLLIEMQAQIKTFYHQNASWMANRQTYAYLRSLVLSSTNGLQYTWEPSFQAGVPSRLLGSPVYEAPDLVGRTSGNFTAGQVPLLYGDFSYGYTVVRHSDFYIINDIYSEASQFVTNLYAMSRYGGAVVRDEAIVQMTITTP